MDAVVWEVGRFFGKECAHFILPKGASWWQIVPRSTTTPLLKRNTILRIAMEQDYEKMYILYTPVKLKHSLADNVPDKIPKKRKGGYSIISSSQGTLMKRIRS
uniref:Uncharacterized protein n=1 Tax=Proboscia inermis TaxID=420281 RepID=A0A7S0CJK3_9STRA|mmetsp:Transcript_51171/g.51585  ORF Transcript_51171/g.51585 Transcript_51171/m.51585 type:complete len:103 (+) Transcript_51171:168-476(+)